MYTKKQEPIMAARREAMLNGWKMYIGSPCWLCGNKLRYTSGSNCVYCERNRAARNYAKRKAALNVPS